MSLGSAAPPPLWQRCTKNYVKTLPILDFPFEQLPDIYAPASTMLRYAPGTQFNVFKWCYLRRQTDSRGILKCVDVLSLSEARVEVVPVV